MCATLKKPWRARPDDRVHLVERRKVFAYVFEIEEFAAFAQPVFELLNFPTSINLRDVTIRLTEAAVRAAPIAW